MRRFRFTVRWSSVSLLTLLLIFPQLTASQGSGFNASRQFITTTVASDIGLVQNNHILYHQIAWIVTGSPASCTVALDSSTDGVNWTLTGLMGNQTCTSNGNSVVTSGNAAFMRINVSALSNGATLTVNYTGWSYNPNPTANGGEWGQITNPTQNQVLNMGAFTTAWTFNDIVGGTDIFSLSTTSGPGRLHLCGVTNSGAQSFWIVGNTVTCAGISISPQANFNVEVATASPLHDALRLYAAPGGTSYAGTLFQGNAVSTGTGYNFFDFCAGATGGDTECGAGTHVATLRGDGRLTAVGAQISGGSPVFDATAATFSGGADPTGTADSTAAINAAITQCGVSGAGGSVFLPRGTYKASSQLVLGQNGCGLTGPSAIIKQNFNSTTGVISVTGTNVKISGIEGDGNNGTNTGPFINFADGSSRITVDSVSLHNCDTQCVGSTGGNVSFVEIKSSRIVSGASASPVRFNPGNGNIVDHLSIHDNFIDGRNITAANEPTVNIKGGYNVVTLHDNHEYCSGQNHEYCEEIGPFGQTTGTFNFDVHDEQQYITAAAGGCISFSGILTGSIHHNNCYNPGHFDMAYCWEIGGNTSISFDGNNCFADNAGQSGMTGILIDANLVDSTVSNNHIAGFGGNNGVGIDVFSSYASVGITSCSETANAVTCISSITLSTTPGAFIQTNSTVYIQGFSGGCSLYNGPALITGFNRGNTPGTNTTFTFNSASTGLTSPCSTGTPLVSFGSFDNQLYGNTVTFPLVGARTGSQIGIRQRCNATHQYCSNNSYHDNTVTGTGIAGEFGFSVISGDPTNVVDNNVFSNNVLDNLVNGFNRTANLTNTKFLTNNFVTVTNQFTGTNGDVGEVQLPITGLASTHVVTRTADVAVTTIYTPGSAMGVWIDTYEIVTRAATTSSTLPTVCIVWTDGDSSVAQATNITASSTANTTTTFASGRIYVRSGATAIQVATGANCTGGTTYASVGGTSMQYALSAVVRTQGN